MKNTGTNRWGGPFPLLAPVLQALLLAATLSLWWAHRNNTLFSNGRWIIGKDTGKYVFYAHDFMFQPLVGGEVNLTSCMGFQEILYRRPESQDRRLVSLQCRASIEQGAYLWIELRKQGLSLLGFRFSKKAEYPSGFYCYDRAGEPVEHVPCTGDLPADGSPTIQIRLQDGRWQALVQGRVVAQIADAGPAEGHFGFRGSGWEQHSVTVRDIVMDFGSAARGGSRWQERETFSTTPAFRRAFPVALLLATLVIVLRVWRRRVLAALAPVDQRRRLALMDHAGALGLLALLCSMQATAFAASVLPVALFLPAGEMVTLVAVAVAMCASRRAAGQSQGATPEDVVRQDCVMFTPCAGGGKGFPPSIWPFAIPGPGQDFGGPQSLAAEAQGEEHGAAMAVSVPAGFLLAIAAIGGVALAVHGAALGRSGRAAGAQRDDAPLAAMTVRPDRRTDSLSFATNDVVIGFGRPLFVEGRAYGAQVINLDFAMPSNSTLDVVFQQQALRTQGDPEGEDLPLQRRLVRLSTRSDVLAGVSRRTDGLPLPFIPIAGRLLPGSENRLTIRCDGNGTEVTLNGVSTRVPGAMPIGFGETGFMAHEGDVALRRITVEPVPGNALTRCLLPAAGVFFPAVLALVVWGLLRCAGPVAFRRVLRLELAAVYPLAFYLAGTLCLQSAGLAGLGRARLVWLDLALVAATIAQFNVIFLLRPRRGLSIVIANTILLAIVAFGATCVWDLLPKDHPLRLRFAKEAIDPGNLAEVAQDAAGPWYNSNAKIGASTYLLHQRFGGKRLSAGKAAGVVRIFVVGGSQAWGSGAAGSSRTFAQLLEDALRARGLPVEVFNAAASGGGISRSMSFYRDVIRRCHPDILIADVGLNESTGLNRMGDGVEQQKHIALHAGFFEELLAECRADGVDVLLALEPMCAETPLRPVVAFYDALESVARKHGAEVVKTGEFMCEREKDRFLWWDTAHFAPYGHQVFAAQLLPVAERLVRSRAGMSNNER